MSVFYVFCLQLVLNDLAVFMSMANKFWGVEYRPKCSDHWGHFTREVTTKCTLVSWRVEWILSLDKYLCAREAHQSLHSCSKCFICSGCFGCVRLIAAIYCANSHSVKLNSMICSVCCKKLPSFYKNYCFHHLSIILCTCLFIMALQPCQAPYQNRAMEGQAIWGVSLFSANEKLWFLA